MRAVVWERHGPAAEVLKVHIDWPPPQRKPGQVLVRAAATSMNAGEWKLRSGFAPIPIKLPKILGEDLAGVVVETPEGSKFKPGDRVFACTGQALKWGDSYGTDAELVAADEATLAAVPPNISLQHAAAVPVAGMTAWQALAPGMPLQGKRVLIHGGAGGVGGFAVQIAKAQGAHVTTTCSTRNVDFVTRELGADAAIDYAQGPWDAAAAAAGQRFDLVLDTIGGPYEAASLRLVAPGGSLSALGATGPGVDRVSHWGMARLLLNAGWRTLAGKLGLAPRYTFVMLEHKASQGLEQVAELLASGKMKVHLDRVFPLEDLASAHEYAERGHVRGKVGITICPDLLG